MFLSDKLGFVRQKRSLCEAGVAPESRPFFKLSMDTNRKTTLRNAPKPKTASYKYSFRLNEEQNIRFNELLCKAGLEHNRSRFIVKRILGEEFVDSHFSTVAIPHQIAALEQRTRELKALSVEILNLAKRAAEWLRI